MQQKDAPVMMMLMMEVMQQTALLMPGTDGMTVARETGAAMVRLTPHTRHLQRSSGQKHRQQQEHYYQHDVRHPFHVPSLSHEATCLSSAICKARR